MLDHPQTQTLSLRISEGLRKRLDHIRELTSLRKGENVSTSEVAKQLLESSPADRLEVAELIREPTECLLRIRKKCEAEQPLSLAEWTVFAYYVHRGAEAFFYTPVSRESCIAFLEAFQAVHRLKKKTNPDKDEYYLKNLPDECRPGERTYPAGPDAVRQTVAETLRQLADGTMKWRPILAARNLYVFLDGDEVNDADAVNRALRPYWEGLWRMAARGHYFLCKKPIRGKVNPSDSVVQPAIPNVFESNFVLSFVRGDGNDVHLAFSFPGPRGPVYPMSSYPLIQEFRAMLNGLTVKSRHWKGEYFFGYTWVWEGETGFSFRAHANDITFGFSPEEWNAVRKLFRRAWEMPELQVTWDELTMEYGDL
jgi:hypothetical protein